MATRGVRPFEVEGQIRQFKHVSRDKWTKDKTNLVWSHFELFESVSSDSSSSTNKPIADSSEDSLDRLMLFECNWKNCSYTITVTPSEITKAGYTKLKAHLQNKDHLGSCFFKSSASSDGNKDDGVGGVVDRGDQREHVRYVHAVLKSGKPYATFTRPGPIMNLLKDHHVPVVSHVTFRKISSDLTEKILEAVRGNFLFLSVDTTPAKDQRDFVTINVHYVADNGDYKRVNLGCYVVDGKLDGCQCGEILIGSEHCF